MAFSGSSDYDSKVAALARRRKMAELLQAEALKGYTPPPAGLAKTSIFQPLGQLAQGLAAGYMDMKTGDEEAALSAQRQKDSEALLDKLQGTEVTVPGTLPRQPGLQTPPPQMEGPPPAEGEPDLRTMLTQKLAEQTEQAGPASTSLIPLNKRDTSATMLKLGDTLGGTAGAAITAKAAESMIPGSKESKATWVTGRDSQGRETHGWADPALRDSPTQGFTQVGGAKADKADSEKALDNEINRIKNNVVLHDSPDMPEPQALAIATSLATKLVKAEVSPVSGRVVYSDIAGHTIDAAKAAAASKKEPPPNPANPQPQALAPPNEMPRATPAAATPPTNIIPAPPQIGGAKPAPWSPATGNPNVVADELGKQKELLAATTDPVQRAQIEKNIAVLAGGAPTAAPAAAVKKGPPNTNDPQVAAVYRQDPRNEPYLPPPPDRNVTGSGTTKHTEAMNSEMKEITKQRATARMPEQETAIKSYENLLEKIAADPKSGIMRDPKTGEWTSSGSIPGFGINQLVPMYFRTPAGQALASAGGAMSNIFSQMRSGLAVTNQEEFRKKLELGTDFQFSPQASWDAYTRYKRLTGSVNEAILGQYAPVVRDTWEATKPEIVGATATVYGPKAGGAAARQQRLSANEQKKVDEFLRNNPPR